MQKYFFPGNHKQFPHDVKTWKYSTNSVVSRDICSLEKSRGPFLQNGIKVHFRIFLDFLLVPIVKCIVLLPKFMKNNILSCII